MDSVDVKTIELAKCINRGELINCAKKSEWYNSIVKMAGEQRQDGERTEVAFSRFVQHTDAGRELWKAYRSADGEDYKLPTPEIAVVAKAVGTAAERLLNVAKALTETNPALSERRALDIARDRNPLLAKLEQTEKTAA